MQTELLVLQPICCTIRAERLGSNLALATRVEDSTLADILPLLPLALGTCGAIPIMGTLVARLAHKGGSSAGANSAPIGQARACMTVQDMSWLGQAICHYDPYQMVQSPQDISKLDLNHS